MKENLSQRKLLEVLTHEIEVLRKTSSNIHAVAPIIEERLQELKQTKITANIDTSELYSVIRKHKEYIQSRTTIPRWFLIVFIVIVVILAIQSVWLYGYLFGS